MERRALMCSLLLIFLVFQLALATELGVKGSQFTVNGKPTFLLGISYYGALGAPKEFILQDLDDIQRYGFNWLRVWATWSAFGKSVSAVDADGNPREPFLSKLRWLVAECDKRGLIVDITLSRGDGVVGPKRLQTLEAHLRAVRTLVTALKEFRNWYLDLANECNLQDDRFARVEELKRLRDEVKRLDPKRLVTASFAGDMDKETLKEFLLTVQVDFLAIHRPRHAKSPKETGEWTKRYLRWMRELGRIVPVHYQEPFRRGFSEDWEPTADDFWTDLVQAKESGAAGWCFHNGHQRHKPPNYQPRRSFDMSERRLFEQLDGEERAFLRRLISARWHECVVKVAIGGRSPARTPEEFSARRETRSPNFRRINSALKNFTINHWIKPNSWEGEAPAEPKTAATGDWRLARLLFFWSSVLPHCRKIFCPKTELRTLHIAPDFGSPEVRPTNRRINSALRKIRHQPLA